MWTDEWVHRVGMKTKQKTKSKGIQKTNTHYPCLKPLDLPGSRQKTRGCLFASGGPVSEEAPRIHPHANQPGQIPSGYSRQKLRDSHTHTQASLSNTLVISSYSCSVSYPASPKHWCRSKRLQARLRRRNEG